MCDCMQFPEKIEEFIDDYSFEDSKEIYTNGSELISVFRVKQALEYYDYENKIKKLEKALDYSIYLLQLQNDGKVDFKKDPLLTISESKESLKERIFKESEEK